MTDHLPHGQLVDYLHGALPPGEDALVFSHLSACTACTAELEAESALSEALKSAAASEELDFPPYLAGRIREYARSESRGPARPAWAPFRFAFAIPLAGAVFAGLLILPAIQRNSTPRIAASYYLLQHASGSALLGDRSTHSTFLIEESSAPPQGTFAAYLGAVQPNGPIDDR
jgi:predicted anti-sigma-YlaC factor YlaD